MEWIEPWIFIAITVTGTLAVATAAGCLIVRIGSAWEGYRAQQQVEARFLKVWDKTKTNELMAWMKVKHQLAREGAPTVVMDAVKQRIAICKARHRRYRSVKLTNGRRVIISTLN